MKVEAASTCEMLATHPTSTQHYYPKARSGMFFKCCWWISTSVLQKLLVLL